MRVTIQKMWISFHVLGVCLPIFLVASSNVNAKPGFINLNCGLPNDSTTTDELGHVYTSDDEYIDSGEIKSIARQFTSIPTMYQTLRSFPNYPRNCYDLKPLTQGTRYLIRASFMYGNYDGQNILPIFDIYLGIDPWYTVKLENASHILWTEIIVTANTSVNVCLVRTGGGIPFISGLEVRPLSGEIYNGTSWLITQMRVNAGSKGPSRFTDDDLDRIWTSDYNGYGTPISNTSLQLPGATGFPVPVAIFQTAEFSSSPISFGWPADDQAVGFFMFAYFSGLIQYGNSEASNLTLDISGGRLTYTFDVEYLNEETLCQDDPVHSDSYSVSISATNGSTRPSISAYEVYKAYQPTPYATYSQDTNALVEIKGPYKLKKNWVGDPCLPRGYLWDGLNCSFSNPAAPRVISLDLSSSGLEGPITDEFAQLNAIQSLNLSGNNLKAHTPLQENQADVPKRQDEPSVFKGDHVFTSAELAEATDNFHQVIGKGGSGYVYHGLLRGSEVAVKKLNNLTSEVAKQFAAEITSLMRVHHKNLVSFIGYCNDENNMIIVYEYMAKGNLQNLLSASECNPVTLTWRKRLEIALSAAIGLEYLHTGCSPPIIHRDVKTSNILLNGNFEAKLADFGLSKTEIQDGYYSTITAVAGTRGYIDPEYSITCTATVKSDVYSFGVVLLEILSGQKPILFSSGERLHIAQWAKSLLLTGDVLGIVDDRMEGRYRIKSIKRVAHVAVRCTSDRGDDRPTMTFVVQELREALLMELCDSVDEGNPLASVSRMGPFEITDLSFTDAPRVPRPL